MNSRLPTENILLSYNSLLFRFQLKLSTTKVKRVSFSSKVTSRVSFLKIQHESQTKTTASQQQTEELTMGNGSTRIHNENDFMAEEQLEQERIARVRSKRRFFIDIIDIPNTGNAKLLLKLLNKYKSSNPKTIEEACLGLQVGDLQRLIRRARREIKTPKGLSVDEQIAIYLYTQPNNFASSLNDAIAQNSQRAIEPWYGYLRLFLSALSKMPRYEGTIWHGVSAKVKTEYLINEDRVWLSFCSCSTSLDFLTEDEISTSEKYKRFLKIDVFNAYQITEYSSQPDIDEVILLPGCFVRVLEFTERPDQCPIFHLQQGDAPRFLLEPVDYKMRTDDKKKDFKIQEHIVVDENTYALHVEGPAALESEPILLQQVEQTKKVPSDREKAKTLKKILLKKNLSEKLILSVVDCIGTISSPRETTEMLNIIVERIPLTIEIYRACFLVIKKINGDNGKSTAMKQFFLNEPLTTEAMETVLSTISTVSSSSIRESLFISLMQNRLLVLEHHLLILKEVPLINGDSQKKTVLCKLAPRLPKEHQSVNEAYLNAANSINSERERAAALMAFVSSSPKKPQGSDAQPEETTETTDFDVQLVSSVNADTKKIELIRLLLGKKDVSNKTVVKIVESIKTMNYSEDATEILLVIARRNDLTNEQYLTSLNAVKEISSDKRKSFILRAYLKHQQLVMKHFDPVIAAVATVYSTDDKEKVLLELIRNPLLDNDHYPAIINEIAKIPNDTRKSILLCRFAERLAANDAHVIKAYLAALESIHTAKDKDEATKAFF